MVLKSSHPTELIYRSTIIPDPSLFTHIIQILHAIGKCICLLCCTTIGLQNSKQM